MKKITLTILLFIISLPCFTETTIDPIGFEQIWLQNNQRNLYKRYYYYNEQVRVDSGDFFLIGIDAAPNKTITTSDGDKEALITRLNAYYQTPNYLFLIDWFSAIPQPQTTEGFTYGDLVIGHTWRNQDNSYYLTLGLRQKSTPRTATVNSETVFNAVTDATNEEYSAFFHFNYHGFDLGTYYSEDNELESTAFYMPISKSDNYSLSATLSYYGDIPESLLSERYEVSFDNVFTKADHDIRSGIIAAMVPDLDKVDISNIYINYTSPSKFNISLVGGLYYYRDIENKENLPGAKLGLTWRPDTPENIQLSFSVQQNAFGDINAIIIRDEPIFTFTLSSGINALH